MKKLLILAASAALVLAASCSKNEVVSTVNDEQHIIGFSNYAPKSILSTRADAANYASSTTLKEGAQFKVYGWAVPWAGDPKAAVAFDGSNGTQFMNWYTVTYQSGGNTSGIANAYPDGYRYWPAGETPDQLSFYAYYPSDKGTIGAPAGFGDFTFTAETSAAAQVDFMVSNLVTDQVYDNTNSGTKGTVALTFNHVLTRVQVKFKTTADIVADANTDVTITGAKLYNINNTGKLPVAFTGIGDWKDVSGAATYDVYFPTTALTATASDVAAADILILVPQTMLANTDASAQYLEVSWDVTTSGVTTHNTKKLYLNDCVSTDGGTTAANIDWAKRQSVTYTVTVGPKPILFTGVAEAWLDWKTGYFNEQ